MENPQSRQELAYEYLKKQIEARVLRPGVIYSETRMAKELQISRTPFKDALVRLSQNRYIDILPSRGFCLHVIGREDVINTFQVRMALEGFCALNLLEHQHTPKGKLTLHQLTQTLDRMQTLGQKETERTEFVRQDTAFHQLLIDFVENKEFAGLFASHLHQIAVLAGESLLQPNRPQDTIQEHRAILQAILDREPMACYRAVETHMIHARDINLQQMAEQTDILLQKEHSQRPL